MKRMAEQSLSLQPLAALQNLVGGGNTMMLNEPQDSTLSDINKSNSPFSREEVELKRVGPSNSVSIVKNSRKSLSPIDCDPQPIPENALVLGGGACTITRITPKDVAVNETSEQKISVSDIADEAVTSKSSTIWGIEGFLDTKRTLNRSGSLDSDQVNNGSESKNPNDWNCDNASRRARSMSLGTNQVANNVAHSFSISKMCEDISEEKVSTQTSQHDDGSNESSNKLSKLDEACTASTENYLNEDHSNSNIFSSTMLGTEKSMDINQEPGISNHDLEELVSGENKVDSTLPCKIDSVLSAVSEVGPYQNDIGPGQESTETSRIGSPLHYENTFEWENTKCCVCNKLAIELEPKLLPCLHTMCGKCCIKLQSEVKDDEDVIDVSPCMNCPVCKRNFPCQDVIDHLLLMEKCPSLKDTSPQETFVCTSCNDEETASGFCSDCSEWLCEACIQAHMRVKVTKDHVIKAKDEISSNANCSLAKKLQYCQSHPKESLNLYCVTCDQLTCRDCQLREHRDHKYKFASEMAAQIKDNFRKLSDAIKKKRAYISSARKLVKERQDQLAKRQQTVQTDIQKLVETFTDIIKQRGETLKDQLQEACKAKEEQLLKKIDVLLHLGNQADYCVSFLEKVLESASELSLLYSKKTVNDYVMKVDKDSPDGNLFNRFKNKLNSGDEISLRISSESRGIGKALKEVGYLLVDNRIYPTSTLESNAKTRSSQASPVSDSSSPRPPSQPQTTVAALPANPSPLHNPIPPASHHTPPVPSIQNQMTPAPPTLTPMHNHHQQQMLQGSPGFHQKYSNFNQCNAINPPGLVRIQPKPSMGSNPNRSNASMNHGLPSYQRMSHMNPQNCRPPDMSGVSSSTHPLAETSHLRGLLGSGGSYKMGSYPQMMRMPQHQPSSRFAQQYQQPRLSDQNQLVLPINPQLAMAAVMAPPIFGGPRGQMNRPMRSPLPLNGNSMPKERSSHNTPGSKIENGVPSWHIPQSSLMVMANSFSNQLTTSTITSAPDNSFKIMLGASKSVSVTPLMQTEVTSEVKPPVTTQYGPSKVRVVIPKEKCSQNADDSNESVTKSSLSVLNSLIGDINTEDNVTPDSSSRTTPQNTTEGSGPLKRDANDPNDDWCAVCWDGGDLICCDYCPKVFHTNCHIPTLSHLPRPTEKWQCMICRDLNQIPEEEDSRYVTGKRKHEILNSKQLKIAQRILLELYCNYEASQPFRELVDRELTEYYEVIQNPMALEIIKKKLKPDSINHYDNLDDFVQDVKLIFKNCYEFNPIDTEIHQNARILEDFFNQLLAKWLPEYDFNEGAKDVADPDTKRPCIDIC